MFGAGRRARRLMVAGLLALAGCGGGGETPSDAASPAASSPAASSPAASPAASSPVASPAPTASRVVATLTEMNIALDTSTLTPGTVTFVAEEKGQAAHALTISGPGVEAESTPVLEPGDPPAELAVTLRPGSYTLWCPVGSHRQQGMETTLTVS